jgi:phage shock protein A
MTLLERVGMLLRANLNDLIDRAEDPEKMVKQIVLDMENQLMQVKTQIAISVADLHLLRARRGEAEQEADDFVRKAELAVSKENDGLARAALARSLDARKRTDAFAQQIDDQTLQVENLKSALHSLTSKLSDARTKGEVLIARHHRARAASKAAESAMALESGNTAGAWGRMKHKVTQAEALGAARRELLGEDIVGQFAEMEKADRIERLLADLKRAKG